MSGLGRMQKLDVDFSVSDEASSEENSHAALVGPLCTPLDFIRRPGEIPKLDLNDHIVIPNVGAYGLTSSLLGFLSRESPLEIVYGENKVIDVSQIVLERKKH
jgi:diaminopimelate decarboxylase